MQQPSFPHTLNPSVCVLCNLTQPIISAGFECLLMSSSNSTLYCQSARCLHLNPWATMIYPLYNVKKGTFLIMMAWQSQHTVIYFGLGVFFFFFRILNPWPKLLTVLRAFKLPPNLTQYFRLIRLVFLSNWSVLRFSWRNTQKSPKSPRNPLNNSS